MLPDLDPKELATQIFGPGAKPLPGFSDAVQAALDRIGEREKIIFFQRLKGKTLKEIGKELGITRERVRQIEAQAVRRLRGGTVKYVIITNEELPPPPLLLVEDIEKLLGQAFRDQRNAWREFRDSFSPEQTMLWQRYWNRCSKIRKNLGKTPEEREERVLAWREFTSSLSEEQQALLRAYRRASAYTKKVRAALQRAREGGRVYAI